MVWSVRYRVYPQNCHAEYTERISKTSITLPPINQLSQLSELMSFHLLGKQHEVFLPSVIPTTLSQIWFNYSN